MRVQSNFACFIIDQDQLNTWKSFWAIKVESFSWMGRTVSDCQGEVWDCHKSLHLLWNLGPETLEISWDFLRRIPTTCSDCQGVLCPRRSWKFVVDHWGCPKDPQLVWTLRIVYNDDQRTFSFWDLNQNEPLVIRLSERQLGQLLLIKRGTRSKFSN